MDTKIERPWLKKNLVIIRNKYEHNDTLKRL